MSRTKKRNKKKAKQRKQLLMACALAAVLFVGGGGAFLLSKMPKEEPPKEPDKSTEINVSFKPGDGAQMENHSAGDLNKDEDHSLPVYLENYFGMQGSSGSSGNGQGSDNHTYPSEGDEDWDDFQKMLEWWASQSEDGSISFEYDSTTDGLYFTDQEGYLEVHFIDVGQGDASLIRFVDTNPSNGDDSAAMLVDAGDGSKGTYVRNYLKEQGVEELKYFVCTHPDADHIGGAASVVSNVPITSGIVWGPDYEKSTKTYENLMNEVSFKSYSYEEPAYGEVYTLGGMAQFMFIAPLEKHDDVNSNSLVFRLWYGGDTFLFVGDCEEEEEIELVSGDYSWVLDANVLKVGHHGSKTSSSEAFLSKVSPDYAIVSCGVGNSYYHPHKTALDHLKASGAELFRTDKQGSIVATSYGQGIFFDKEPTDDWSPGGE